MFIVIEKSSKDIVSILDTDDYTIEECSLEDCKKFINLGMQIKGATLIEDKLKVNVEEKLNYLSDSLDLVTVFIRHDGAVAMKYSDRNRVIFSQNKIGTTRRNTIDIKSVIKWNRTVVFDIGVYTQDDNSISARTEVHSFNLDTKRVKLLYLDY